MHGQILEGSWDHDQTPIILGMHTESKVVTALFLPIRENDHCSKSITV